jgi:hypothetical protein
MVAMSGKFNLLIFLNPLVTCSNLFPQKLNGKKTVTNNLTPR